MRVAASRTVGCQHSARLTKLSAILVTVLNKLLDPRRRCSDAPSLNWDRTSCSNLSSGAELRTAVAVEGPQFRGRPTVACTHLDTDGARASARGRDARVPDRARASQPKSLDFRVRLGLSAECGVRHPRRNRSDQELRAALAHVRLPRGCGVRAGP